MALAANCEGHEEHEEHEEHNAHIQKEFLSPIMSIPDQQ
jgi:hypothetical protein